MPRPEHARGVDASAAAARGERQVEAVGARSQQRLERGREPELLVRAPDHFAREALELRAERDRLRGRQHDRCARLEAELVLEPTREARLGGLDAPRHDAAAERDESSLLDARDRRIAVHELGAHGEPVVFAAHERAQARALRLLARQALGAQLHGNARAQLGNHLRDQSPGGLGRVEATARQLVALARAEVRIAERPQHVAAARDAVREALVVARIGDQGEREAVAAILDDRDRQHRLERDRDGRAVERHVVAADERNEKPLHRCGRRRAGATRIEEPLDREIRGARERRGPAGAAGCVRG